MNRFARAPALTGLLVALALLGALEVALRLAGTHDYRDRPDPFAGFSGLQPLFERVDSPEGERWVARKRAVGDTRSFPVRKPEDGFRVFVLGGSSAAGVPYGYPYAFARWLEMLLDAAVPQRHVEVVNAAAAGFGSRRLLYAAREIARYEPDLVVVYTGHNELVEQRLYAHLYNRPAWLFTMQETLRRSAVYILLEDALRPLTRGGGVVIDAQEIYAAFGVFGHKDWLDDERDRSDQQRLARAMFRTNIEQIIHVARSAGARVVLITQAKNYADWPITGESEQGSQGSRWREAVASARASADSGRLESAMEELEVAGEAVGAGAAAVYWEQASLLRAHGRPELAAELYRRAHARSHANFGTTPERNRLLREIARARGTMLVDIDRVLAEESPDGIVGFNWFVDFLHPNLRLQELIAMRVFETLRHESVPLPPKRWSVPPPLPSPEELYAIEPRMQAQELKVRILADLVSDRRKAATEHYEQLVALAPDDPQLERIRGWVSGEVPIRRKAPPRDTAGR